MPTRRPPALSFLAVLLLLTPAPRAQEDDHRGLPALSDKEEGEQASWWDATVLGGAWGGARSWLEERGTTLSVNVIADSSWPLSGGLRQRRTARALVDVALEVDLERAAGLSGTTLFAELYSLSGRNASDDVGDVQGFSNIDGDHVTQLAELWLQRSFADGDLRIKLGKLDANSEFAHVHAGQGFLHSSAGYSPTIFTLPTYPDPAVSLNVFAHPGAGWYAGLGVYNAQDGGTVSGRRGLTSDFDATFLIGQLDRTWECAGGGRLALGVWHHTGDFTRFDGGGESGTEGPYAVLEQRLSREHPNDPGDTQGLTGFLQWGGSDDDLSAFEAHLGAGLVYTGLLPERDAWQTGLYLSHVDLTDAPAAGLGGSELAVELFQEIRLGPSLVLKPDLQYIVDPAGSDGIRDAWVATLRLELSL
jgi:porin